jgi:uncharacterized protein YdeI (YjbR/CyaY-like superfamily)
MTISMNPKVDAYVRTAKTWRAETEKVRTILLGSGLSEELKWGKPCYSFEGHNVIVVQGFKSYFALLFCKGSLLKDAKKLLVKPGENTQGTRQMRFESAKEIAAKESTLKTYLKEAIAAEKAGREVEYKPITEHKAPEELQARLDKEPKLKAAFQALTPGRQRAYYILISGAKQSATREARVEKCKPRILAGKGLNDF